jgi:hypothetical protein
MILKSYVFTCSDEYYLETGLLLETNFTPAIRVAQRVNNGANTAVWSLNTEEWFLLMRKRSNELMNFFTTNTSDASGGTPSSSSFSSTTKKKITLGRYTFHFNNESKEINVYGSLYDVQPVTITLTLLREMIRYYDMITLHLAMLNKYHLFAKFAFSYLVNFYVKKKNLKNFTKLTPALMSEEDFGCILPHQMTVLFGNLDDVLCRLIVTQIKILASEKVYKQVLMIKNYYSTCWYGGEYFVSNL